MTASAVRHSLKIARKLYARAAQQESAFGRKWNMFSNKAYSNELISSLLYAEKPCMIARLGATELSCMINCLGVKQGKSGYKNFITGQSLAWWWEPKLIKQIQDWSGFFGANPAQLERFFDMMLRDMGEVDLLGSWLKEEKFFEKELAGAKRVVLEDLEPFFCDNPWTRALAGKKVLVVHPFAETIERQYEKRYLLFDNLLLPDFELSTIKAVQTLAGEQTDFRDWFEALDWMKMQIDSCDYDICIIGCGAYGFPLAAHVKRMGKKAVHLAGATQLLFGIKGKRWEDFIVWPYQNLFNEHWVRAGATEKPKNAVMVEGACYW